MDHVIASARFSPKEISERGNLPPAPSPPPSRLLGFYQGFPIFDGSTGFAKLPSHPGIHIDQGTVMISTPLDKYEADVYELAESLSRQTGLDYSKKKNRVIFPNEELLLERLGIKE